MSLQSAITSLGRSTKRVLSAMSGRYITSFFVDDIIATGRFTEARQRIEQGTAQPDTAARYAHRPTWELILDEVLDTDFELPVYDAIYLELVRRGYCHEDIDSMRRLAWETAGWLNYDMMVWDWVHLDESDMRRALNMQHTKGFLSAVDYQRRLAQIQEITDRPIPA